MATPTPSGAPVRGAQRPHTASLLELVPELGDELGDAARSAVRRGGTITTISLPLGPWTPAATGEAFGFLVADGAIVRDVLLAGCVASDLLGPGEVAALGSPDTTLMRSEMRWTVSAPTRVAVLDHDLLATLVAWPDVVARLLARATQQTATMAVQRAISQLPRVEQRLLALFWHLAERWGRVGRDGIVVRLALTHETLGRMVGARRPTVSLALKELATEGTVIRRMDGAWVLRREGVEALAAGPEADGWQVPDAVVLPELGLAPAVPARPQGDTRPEDLRFRLVGLDETYQERARRVREVLERCAATREELIRSRERRQAGEPRSTR